MSKCSEIVSLKGRPALKSLCGCHEKFSRTSVAARLAAMNSIAKPTKTSTMITSINFLRSPPTGHRTSSESLIVAARHSHRMLLITALMLANLAGSASAVTLLRTAAQEGTAPKFIAAPPGSAAPITGLCIDIMRAIERVEPAVRFVGDQTWMPLARVEAELLAGYQDAAFCLVRNAAREAQTIFIEPPLYSVDFVLAVRADDDIRIRSWDDVRKLDKASIVLAMHNSGAINRVSGEGASIAFDTSAKTPEQNLKKLMAGRGRFFYHRKPGLEGEIRRAGLEGKVRILSPPMDSTLSYLVLGKHVPQETVEKIRKAVAQLHASGELARIFEKWDTE